MIDDKVAAIDLREMFDDVGDAFALLPGKGLETSE